MSRSFDTVMTHLVDSLELFCDDRRLLCDIEIMHHELINWHVQNDLNML